MSGGFLLQVIEIQCLRLSYSLLFYIVCNLPAVANLVLQYDIVNHAQRQTGKLLILYFALVRGLNQYLERLLESLYNMLMVKIKYMLAINSLFKHGFFRSAILYLYLFVS